MRAVIRDRNEENRIRQQGDIAVIQIAAFVDSLPSEDCSFKDIMSAVYLSAFIYAYYSGLNCTELLCEGIKFNWHLMWLTGGAEPSFDSIQEYREENEEKIRATLKAFRSYSFSEHILRYPDILFKGYRPDRKTRADRLSHDAEDDDVDLFLRDYAYNDRYEHPVKRPDISSLNPEAFEKWLKELDENDRKENAEAERDRAVIEEMKRK